MREEHVEDLRERLVEHITLTKRTTKYIAERVGVYPETLKKFVHSNTIPNTHTTLSIKSYLDEYDDSLKDKESW